MYEFGTSLKKDEEFFSSQGKPLEIRFDFGRISGELLATVQGNDSFAVTA